MALFFSEGQSAPLMDASMSVAMRRRMLELIGLGVGALAILLGMCLWSYDVADPSWFSATTRDPSNWLGAAGAIIADPLMRYLGLGSWVIVALLGVWALRFVCHVGEERLVRRLPAALGLLVLAMPFASTHPVHADWQLAHTGLGGTLGDSMARWMLDVLPLSEMGALLVLTLLLGCVVLGLGLNALGFAWAELSGIWRWLWRSFAITLGTILHLVIIALVTTVAKLRDVYRAWRARPRSEKLAPAEPTGSWRFGMSSFVSPSGDTAPDHRTEPEIVVPDTGTARGAIATAMRRLAGSDPTDADLEPDATDETDQPDVTHRPAVERERRPARKSRKAASEQQPSLDLEGLGEEGAYQAPPLALLQAPTTIVRHQTSDAALEENARMLETVLEDYGVRGEIIAVKPGPVVTLYELEPAPGLKASRVIGLADDIARSMSALSARVSTVPGRSIIGIELPNTEREKVWLRDVFETPHYGDARYPLTLALGKDISGAPVVTNLAKMPHLLIAGTTGSGKSVAINTMILSLLYRLSPHQCRLIMIDPKMLELSVYDNIPHLLAPVVTDPKKALVALKWVVAEMEERYRKMSKMGVRNIDGYNARVREALDKEEAFSRTVQTGFDETTGEPVYETETFEPEEMPLIVVIVDELADLMMVAGKEIEACIQRLAQMARASGIHLIMATQRPSVDVITGTIKANFPTRISFQVTSKIDSRTILGEQGAEQLLGMGDMLYMAGGGRITRVHGPFVSDEEVEEVVAHLKTLGTPDYVSAVTEGSDDETEAMVDEKLGLAQSGDTADTLYDKAVAIVARDRKCSTSYIQRKLAIGYNKAARLVEQMEDQGVVTPANAVGKREILVEER